MKLLLSITLILVAIGVSAQEETAISRIKEDFSQWQSLLTSRSVEPQLFYHYAWGNNYANERWTKQTLTDTVTLVEEAKVFTKDGLGHLVTISISSFSGDWVITTENYYDVNGNLYFIFWTMNTFQAEVPLTVEKRLYFGGNGRPIKTIQSVYKMNSKAKVDIKFADHDVAVVRRYGDFEFFQ